MNSYPLLDKLETNKNLTDDELTLLIDDNAPELAAELADLEYHMLVLMADMGITLDDLYGELESRR